MILHKKHPIKITLEDIKEVIKSYNLADLRALDVCVKERRDEILKNNEEPRMPAESLAVSNIRGNDYLYLHKRVNGKQVSRVVNEYDLSELNLATIKISPKAKELLLKKYKLEVA